MQIRTAVLADAASLIELWTAAGLKFRPADVPAELQAIVARDPDLIVVAEDADGLAAAVLGSFDGRRGWVNRLATRPRRRGHGHASAVLAELERRLAAKGCRKVNLLIELDNQRVTGFYRRHGYTEDQLIFMESGYRRPQVGSQPPRRGQADGLVSVLQPRKAAGAGARHLGLLQAHWARRRCRRQPILGRCAVLARRLRRR